LGQVGSGFRVEKVRAGWKKLGVRWSQDWGRVGKGLDWRKVRLEGG
jgi:hypothetical protein